MAGSKSSLTGEDFYGMYDAQEFAIKHAPELGMQAVPSLDVVYTEEAGYVTAGALQGCGSWSVNGGNCHEVCVRGRAEG
jgi:sulfate adenylyltransferase